MDRLARCIKKVAKRILDSGFWILDRQKWILDRVADFVWLLKYTTVLHLQEVQRLLLQTQLITRNGVRAPGLAQNLRV